MHEHVTQEARSYKSFVPLVPCHIVLSPKLSSHILEVHRYNVLQLRGAILLIISKPSSSPFIHIPSQASLGETQTQVVTTKASLPNENLLQENQFNKNLLSSLFLKGDQKLQIPNGVLTSLFTNPNHRGLSIITKYKNNKCFTTCFPPHSLFACILPKEVSRLSHNQSKFMCSCNYKSLTPNHPANPTTPAHSTTTSFLLLNRNTISTHILQIRLEQMYMNWPNSNNH